MEKEGGEAANETTVEEILRAAKFPKFQLLPFLISTHLHVFGKNEILFRLNILGLVALQSLL